MQNMSIVILTPLFPPDPSVSARYVKLLASKLQPNKLSVIAYGQLPESVSGVPIIPISKRSNKLTLIVRCLAKLLELRPTILLVQNGPSSELPALLYSYLRTVKIIYIISDIDATKQTRSWLPRLVTRRIASRSAKVITLPEDSSQFLPAEWLPFAEQPIDSSLHDAWWQTHIQTILHDNKM